MAHYNYQWPYTSMTQPNAIGIYELDELPAQMETLSVICDYCAGPHPSHQCTISFESIQYGGNFGDYSNNYAYPNNYQQDWEYHSNFSGQQPHPQQEKKSDLEELLIKYIKENETWKNNHEVTLRNIENQLGQLVNAVNNRPQGVLPSNMISEIDGVPEPIVMDAEKEDTSGGQEKKVGEDSTLSSNADEPILIVHHVPSPQKLKDPGSFAIPCPIGSHVISKALCDMRASISFEPWLDETIDEDPVVFKKLQFNIPFTDTTGQTPSYLQFIKEFLSKSNKLGELETMALIEGKPSKVMLLMMDGGFLNFRRGIG